MKNSYINFNQAIKGKYIYQQLDSYIANMDDADDAYIATQYTMLPEEYSIFSEIDSDFFWREDTEQHRFLSACLQYLRSQLFKIYIKFGVLRILPKLNITSDEDDAIILNWVHKNYRIYFNFEKQIEDSYYGIVAQNTEEIILTKTEKLTESNYSLVVDGILGYAIDNS